MTVKDPFCLSNKTALITGASRGLGRAIALAFAEAGADVALVSRGKEALNTLAQEIEGLGRKSWGFPFDLTRVKKISDRFDQILNTTKRLDVLVNVAGMIHREPAVDFPLEKWEEIITLNLTSPFVLSQCFARACFVSKQPGKIINIASLASERTRGSIPAYNASKGGIRQLTRSLAVEWASHQINVNAIGPGYFETELTKSLVENKTFNRWVLDNTPMNRWGQPDDLVGAAVFLASKASDFITGQVLYVDGGWLASL